MTEVIGTALPEQKSMSGFSRIWGIFFRPKEVFASLKAKSNWLAPFILISIVSLVFGYLTYEPRMADIKENVLSNPQYTEEQRAAIEARFEQQAGGKWTTVFTPVGVLIYLMFITLVLFLVFNVFLGGKGSFKSMLSIFTYSTLVGIPGSIIQTPLIMAKNSIEKVHTDLAILLPVDLSDKFYYQFLAGLDFFIFWQVLLIATGVSIIYQITFKKSLTTVMILWILLILVVIGIRQATGGMFGI